MKDSASYPNGSVKLHGLVIVTGNWVLAGIANLLIPPLNFLAAHGVRHVPSFPRLCRAVPGGSEALIIGTAAGRRASLWSALIVGCSAVTPTGPT